jgi:catechol 2,3-dioxygenase-like lactoylglutathione lyase family enzyme
VRQKVISHSLGRLEPFAGVRLRVSSLERTVSFYRDVIGMQELAEDKLEVSLGDVPSGCKSAYMSFLPSHCVYQFVEDPSKYNSLFTVLIS